MMTLIASVYLKLNLLLLASLLLWYVIRGLARVSKLNISFKHELTLARSFFCLTLLVPLLLPFLQAFNTFQNTLPGMLVIGQSINAGIDNNMGQQLSLAGQQYSLGTLFIFFLVLGVLLGTLLTARHWLQLKSLVQNGTTHRHINHIWIIFSAETNSPFSTQALGKKQIILPYQLLDSPRNLQLAIKHELQHIRNGDLRWVFLLELLKPVFFWNPSYHVWLNEFHCLQEYACDEQLVSRPCIASEDYSTCLLEVASHQPVRVHLASSNMIPAFSYFQTAKSQLLKRIVLLQQPTREKFEMLKLTIITTTLCTSLLGLSAALLAQPEPDAERLEYLPTKTVPPQYPPRGLRNRIMGFTHLNFNVDTEGFPGNITVVNECFVPEVYDPEANTTEQGCLADATDFEGVSIAALAQFEFNPRMEEGQAVATEGVQYVFRFSLDESDIPRGGFNEWLQEKQAQYQSTDN